MTTYTYTIRLNRAVGAFDKGAIVVGDPTAKQISSLLGAGYADLVGVHVEDEPEPEPAPKPRKVSRGRKVRGEPGDDAGSATGSRAETDPPDHEPNRSRRAKARTDQPEPASAPGSTPEELDLRRGADNVLDPGAGTDRV